MWVQITIVCVMTKLVSSLGSLISMYQNDLIESCGTVRGHIYFCSRGYRTLENLYFILSPSCNDLIPIGIRQLKLVFKFFHSCINTRYYDVRPIAPSNAPVEEPALRGRSQGRGRVRVRGRGYEKVALIVNEVPNDHVLGNEIPPAHEEVIEEDEDVHNVEEVEQEKGGQAEPIGITPIIPVLVQ